MRYIHVYIYLLLSRLNIHYRYRNKDFVPAVKQIFVILSCEVYDTKFALLYRKVHSVYTFCVLAAGRGTNQLNLCIMDFNFNI